jgi:hypothetical protein
LLSVNFTITTACLSAIMAKGGGGRVRART